VTTLLFPPPRARNGPPMPSGEIQLQEPPALPEIRNNAIRAGDDGAPVALMTGVHDDDVSPAADRGPTTWNLVGLMVVAMAANGRVPGDVRRRRPAKPQDRRRPAGTTSLPRPASQTFVRRPWTKQRAGPPTAPTDPRRYGRWPMTHRRWERRPTHPDFLSCASATWRPAPVDCRSAAEQTRPDRGSRAAVGEVACDGHAKATQR